MNVGEGYVGWPKLIFWPGQKNYTNKGLHVTLIMSAPLVLESLETGKIKTGTKKVFTIMIQMCSSSVQCVRKASWVKPVSTITLRSPTRRNPLGWNASCARKPSAMNRVSRGMNAQVAVTSWVTKTESFQGVNYAAKLFQEKITWLYIRQKFMVFTTFSLTKLKKSSVKMMEVWNATHVANNS